MRLGPFVFSSANKSLERLLAEVPTETREGLYNRAAEATNLVMSSATWKLFPIRLGVTGAVVVASLLTLGFGQSPAICTALGMGALLFAVFLGLGIQYVVAHRTLIRNLKAEIRKSSVG